ncbi:MAG: PIN domain-containing protein [Candidatus Latescibacterota bacterium]
MKNGTPESNFVTDTMGFVLRLEQRKLGPTAKGAFDSVERGNATVYVPALVFAEILYLSEKQRIMLTLQEVSDYLEQFPNCRAHPMDFAVIQTSAQIADIRELHDRLIAGTARLLDLVLITNDPIIQASVFVKTAW